MELEEMFYCTDCTAYYHAGENLQLHNRVYPQHHTVLLKDHLKTSSQPTRFEYVSPFFEPDNDNNFADKALNMLMEEENRAPKKVDDFMAYLNIKKDNTPEILEYITRNFQPEIVQAPKSIFGRRLQEQFNKLKKSTMNQERNILEVTKFSRFLSEIRDEMTDRKQSLDEKHKSCLQKLKSNGTDDIDKFMKTLVDVEDKLKELQSDVELYHSIQTEFKNSPAYTQTMKIMNSHLMENRESVRGRREIRE